jgi:hypothetical protein
MRRKYEAKIPRARNCEIFSMVTRWLDDVFKSKEADCLLIYIHNSTAINTMVLV